MKKEIILGDCFEELVKLPNSSVDLILTDPPYQISRKSNFTKNSDNSKYNKISLEFGDWDYEKLDTDFLFKEFYRILKPSGSLIIFYDIWKSNDLLHSSKKFKFKQPRVCQWVKTNPVPINSKVNYLSNAVEYFFTFVKKGKSTFNSEYDKGIYHYPICHGKERTIHPTQKPTNLIKELILKHSNKGNLILDCFAGSGTVGLCCKDLERGFILIEMDKSYYELINTRLNVKTSEGFSI
jgi:site-specific DNA-methyltransferase (adenine-specific)